MAQLNNGVDWFDSQPTAAQRSAGDSSQTELKAMYVSERDLVRVDESNVDEVFDNLPYTNNTLLKTQNMFHSYTKSEFISHLISDVADTEIGMEELRDLLYTEIKGLKDYPYSQKCELKKRIHSRRGETVIYKLAADVYSLVNVLDGAPFEEVKDILSQAPKNTRNDMNSSMPCTQKNAANIDVLAATVAQLQADMLQIKGKNVSLDTLRKDVDAIRTEMNAFHQEADTLLSELKKSVAENSLAVQRIHDIFSSDSAKAKSDIKQMRTEICANHDSLETAWQRTSDHIDKHSKQMDKRLHKVESKIRAFEAGNNSNQFSGISQGNDNVEVVVRDDADQDHINGKRNPSSDSHDDIVITGEERFIGPAASSSVGRLRFTNIDGSLRFSRMPASQPRCDPILYTDVVKGQAGAARRQPESCDLKPAYGQGEVTKGKPESYRAHQPTGGVTFPNTSGALQRSRDQQLVAEGGARKPAITSPGVPCTVRPKEIVTENRAQVDRRDDDPARDQHGDQDLSGFIQHVRKRTKRFFLGGFKSSINETLIKNYVKGGGGPKVDSVSIITPRYSSDVIIRLSVETQNSQVLLEPDFWPEGVRCRPWYPRRTYNKNSEQNRFGEGPSDQGLTDQDGYREWRHYRDTGGAARYPRARYGDSRNIGVD